MASALDLPAASGNIVGTDSFPAGSDVNLVGFSLRAAAAAVSINIRERSATGQIVLYLGLPASGCTGDMFPRVITCRAPLYCEFVTGAAAGLGAVYIG